jgi:hypothetical protein
MGCMGCMEHPHRGMLGSMLNAWSSCSGTVTTLFTETSLVNFELSQMQVLSDGMLLLRRQVQVSFVNLLAPMSLCSRMACWARSGHLHVASAHRVVACIA